MADDQQFCLRWNNHQSTLISVFDTLLENGTLVDCTLAAEGQSLKAHKVVLSACSPYLETLLSEHYEKHPIIIMKDVKFTELKSMMDYMYRGEVNICQDQLGTFLKAAESLQIKGLSENGEGDARDVGSTTTRPPPPKRPPATPAARTDPEQPPAASPAHRPRDGSISPSSRKRRRTRRNSDDANHFDSNSCDLPLTPAQSTPVVPIIPASITSTPIRTPVVKPEINDRLDHNSLPPESGLLKEKIEPAEQLLEPKTEYLEDLNNDDSVEDLTLDDDDEMDMSQMSNMSNMSRPGPSHGTDISNQGFSPWQLGNQSGGNDEVFMAAQEAVNSHRDSQDDAAAEDFAHLRSPGKLKGRVGVLCSSCGSVTRVGREILHKDTCEVGQYICKCGRTFQLKRDLLIHKVNCKTPLPNKKGTCVKCKCGSFFASRTNLSYHIGKCFATKGENKEKVVCKCGKKCLSLRGYRTHRKYCNRSPTPPDQPEFTSLKISPVRTKRRDTVDTKDEDENSVNLVRRKSFKKKSFSILNSDEDSDEDNPTIDKHVEPIEKPVKEFEVVRSDETSFRVVEKISEENVPSTSKNADLGALSVQSEKKTPKPPRHVSFSSAFSPPGIAFIRPSDHAEALHPVSSPQPPEEQEKLTKEDLNGRYTQLKERQPGVRLKCKCSRVFNSVIGFRLHKTKGCKRKVKCHWCDYETDKETRMKHHVVKKHSDSVLELLAEDD